MTIDMNRAAVDYITLKTLQRNSKMEHIYALWQFKQIPYYTMQHVNAEMIEFISLIISLCYNLIQ